MKYIVKFWERYKFAFLVFGFWRISLLVIGYWSIGLLPFKASFPYIDGELISSGFPQWFWQWGNFDGVHYLGIAKEGYARYNTQVFFPLYPILIKFGNLFINNWLASALSISNLFALLSGILLQKFGGKWAVLFFYLFPTAFFLGAVYTESLLFFLILLTFYKSKIFGFLAGLTKLVGGFSGVFGWLGVAVYMVFLKINFDNPLMFLFSQGSFKNGRANDIFGLISPFQTVYRYIKIFFTADPNNIAYWVSVLELSSFIFAISVLTYLTIKRKFSLLILAFCWMTIIVPSLTGTLASMPRYIIVLFPIYLFLAKIKRLRLKLIILILFAILQLVLTVYFLRGYFIS